MNSLRRAVILAGLVAWSPRATAQTAMRLERMASTASDPDIGSIGTIAASRFGDLYVSDTKTQQIVVYDSAGRRKRTIGRNGEGPLEFRGLGMIAWLGDTLVAYDWRARRLTFVKPDGTLLRTAPWTAEQYPVALFGSGGPGLHALAYGKGRQVPMVGIEGYRIVRPRKSFLRIAADGSISLAAGVSDTTTDPLGHDCWNNPKGTIHSFTDYVGGNGPFNAFTSRGDFVSLSSERTRIDLAAQPSGSPPRMAATYARVPANAAVWAHEAMAYTEAEKKDGSLTCSPKWVRPDSIPPIRSIVADDAGGLWAEVTTGTGIRFDLYDATGKLRGSVTAPVRPVQTIPFVVRGDKLYVAEKDADDVVSITTYRVRR